MSFGDNDIENALAYLTCVLVARRTRTTPERVTWQQYDVLEMLRLHGPMTPSALSESLRVSRPTMSKALRVLKDRHLVEQAALGADRREQTTSLTAAGREFLDRAAQCRRDNADIAASVLSPAERRVFAELCARVAAALGSD
ncbi:MarR family winged helix-turn-helix transcriptional regulator [Nocardia sp. CDC159]|uniref:MarR family winged helix-turn-helix transcriptional regulator n=1 Tax=Nocardia pulmonis TaxID=2951408 RepID=A0A9X2J088_9NOCA|nr:MULTISPECIES: MarR family winged helix-turn-helix transcriptional regulator [Nocardia]MCM6778283.1 MarR family winged helix-turn-helix transcriptional regulator [Nocardia pulmonis]MCM6791172.1 MarR family winged helix-turn-helix transcriptional regulator [Nocardia sp. CDC159]